MAQFGEVIIKRIIMGSLCTAFVIYSAVIYTSGTEAQHIATMSDQARHGQQLFQEHNCVACHQFYGLGGYMGPDLTNVISNRGEAYSRAFIMAGTERMPNLGLDLNQADALLAYLAFVDQTGTYPPDDYNISWTGVVAQEDDPK